MFHTGASFFVLDLPDYIPVYNSNLCGFPVIYAPGSRKGGILLDGFKFEQVCARRLRRNGYRHVTVTQESGDQGLDIIAWRRGKKYGIQCKYYSHPVGNKAVQEAHAGASFYDCEVAVVMTNTTFTRQAEELAQRTSVKLWPNNHVDKRFWTLLTEWTGLLCLFLGLAALAAGHFLNLTSFPIDDRLAMLTAAGGLVCIFGAHFRIPAAGAAILLGTAAVLISSSFGINWYHQHFAVLLFLPAAIALVGVFRNRG